MLLEKESVFYTLIELRVSQILDLDIIDTDLMLLRESVECIFKVFLDL